MRRVALTLRADAVEDVVDVLMPLLPRALAHFVAQAVLREASA